MNAVAWLAALAPAIVAAGVIAALRGSRIAGLLVDRPNERSLHAAPTPRLGGIGVAAGIASVAPLFWTWPLNIVFSLAAILFAVSLADDARSLPMQARLAAHFAAAGVLAALLVSNASDEPIVRVAVVGLTVLAVAWMTNLFNFMDGADGLAGGMAVIGFGAFAAAAWATGATVLALAAAAVASASAGFLAHNFPPARVFLGDAGSIPLGFLAAALGVHGVAAGLWPAWFPVLVFSPFIVDATATLVARALGGKKFWRAHREHYYQRLSLAGWPRRRLLLAAYMLMAATAATALVGLTAGEEAQLGILLGWAAVYPALLFWIARRPVG